MNVLLLGALLPAALNLSGCREIRPAAFPVAETTIAEIHAALRSGRVTCRRLTEACLRRIEVYDQATGLNAIVIVNPAALADADRLDAEFRRIGHLRPLHGIPIIIKDNYDTAALQTTGGSIALKGSLPPDDAFQVRRLREAGAVILAKSNMAEWAFNPYLTESSIAGVTRNPYDLERVPAGSSGGTAAAVAASFSVVGLGTDTGNSIRGPSSHTCLVGIRPTMGLTSRDGIIPLFLRNDVGGPMARTVEDAVRVLDVIAGYDPADPITVRCQGKVPENYLQFLDRQGLAGARIGVFRHYLDQPTADPAINELMEKAITDLRLGGAEVIDPMVIADFEALTRNIWSDTFRHDVNHYLASLGADAPYGTIEAIVAAGLYAPYIQKRLQWSLNVTVPPEEMDPPSLDVYHDPRNIALREAVLAVMDEYRLDAFVYPTWSNPPRKVGDLDSPAGDNSQYLSPHTGFPAITVPIGFVEGNLPAGMTFIGRLFAEPTLIRLAYAYEQATRHRRPPAVFQELNP
ncbi:MAG: amidase [Acidobacteria bacterium]|nr:amidase [Acidobacteriota bacterium]